MPKKGPKTPAPFPDKSQILDFLAAAESRVGKREIAQAFHIRGDDRVRLKGLLREMRGAGLIVNDGGKGLRPADQLPAVMVVRVVGPLAGWPTPADSLNPELQKGKEAPQLRFFLFSALGPTLSL